MRIGVLTTSFPRRPHDIAGHFVLGMCRALARRGHAVEVLAPEPREGRPDTRFGRITVHHVPYLRPRRCQRTFYGSGVPDNLRLDPRAFLGAAPFTLALWRACLAHSRAWDAVISHWAVPCALVAGLVPRRPRHVAVLHSADVHALTWLPGGSTLEGQVARSADALWFVSANLRDRFLRGLPARSREHALAKSHVCPMGIDPPASDTMEYRDQLGRDHGRGRETGACEISTREAFNHDHEHTAPGQMLSVGTGRPPGLLLLALGRLVPVKGLDVAIEAVAGMPGVQLVLAGEGPERARLARKAAAAGNVRLIGPIFGAEKRAWLEASDALLLPSRRLASGRSEGAPTVLLEAMDAGLPVIASDVGGVGEVLEHPQGGYLVPPDHSAALAAAIERLRCRATRSRMGHHNRARARQFHWDVLAPHAEALLARPGDLAAGQTER